MAWLSRSLLTVLVLLGTQSILALGQGSNPWSSKENAEGFMRSFMGTLNQNSAFSGDQMDDISSIGDTLLTAIDNMGGKATKSKLQALNMAFASAVAEIAVDEEGGQSVGMKTDAITNALQSAFYQTTGSGNDQFVNEIRSLIQMFAQSQVNNISTGSSSGASYGTFSSASSAAVSGRQEISGSGGWRGQSTQNSVPGGQRGIGQRGGQGGWGGQGGQGSGSAAAAAAAGSGGQGGMGQGGIGQGSGQGGQGGWGGQGGQGSGSAAAAAAAAGSGGQGGIGQGGQGGWGGQGGQGSGSSAAAAAGSGGQGGMGSQGRAVSSSTASIAASRLSLPSANSRISSTASSLASNGVANTATLGSIISNTVSQISADNYGASECDVLVQALLELITALVHILSSSNIGQVNYSDASRFSQIISQALQQAMG